MQATSHWKAWLDAHKIDAARRVASRIGELLDLEMVDLTIEPYFKGGFVAAWVCAHEVLDRNALFVAAIGAGQGLANGWILGGSIHDELTGLASVTGQSRISIAGVSMLTWRAKATDPVA